MQIFFEGYAASCQRGLQQKCGAFAMTTMPATANVQRAVQA
jgi:hypothetical protein